MECPEDHEIFIGDIMVDGELTVIDVPPITDQELDEEIQAALKMLTCLRPTVTTEEIAANHNPWRQGFWAGWCCASILLCLLYGITWWVR